MIIQESIRCTDIKPEKDGINVFTFKIKIRNPEYVDKLKSGNYVAIQYPNQLNGINRRRHYSIVRTNGIDQFEIAVKSSGKKGVSDYLNQSLEVGMSVDLDYISGNINIDKIKNYKNISMIAGGVGITLPIALLRELNILWEKGLNVPEVNLIFVTKKVIETPFLNELFELSHKTSWFNFKIYITQDIVKNSYYFIQGRPNEKDLKRLYTPQAVIICGSNSFASFFEKQVKQLYADTEVLIESFSSLNFDEKELIIKNQSFRLYINDNQKMIMGNPGNSLLEICEENSIKIRNQCRSGICGSCRVKIKNGEFKLESDFCLSAEERRSGYVLACCTFPLNGNIQVYLENKT